MRRAFGVNEFDFLQSVCGNANFIQFISNAKSGQFLFYSTDGKYMIKTITTTESKFLRRILPHYFRHCVENPNTTMSRFFGMYRVKMYHLEKRTKFIIMNSVFDTDKYLHSFYDLKGSILGRKAKKSDTVKKDNDLREKLPKSAISLHPSVREKMRKQLEIDCNFLASMKIMDYSLLVGIHEKPIVWETNTTLSEPISPGGTHSVAVEVESFPFRKRWNQPVSSVPMFPSISILNDGGIEVLNNSNTASPISMLSGDSHVVSMKNSPSLLIPDNNVRPGLLPKEKSLSNRNSKQNKLNRANSAPNARSLLSGSLQTSQKRFSTTGTGLSNTATDTNEGIIDISWPRYH